MISAAAGTPGLLWRAPDCAIRTINTAVSRQRFQQRPAVLAFVKILTCIFWHHLLFPKAAVGAGDHRFKIDAGCHVLAVRSAKLSNICVIKYLLLAIDLLHNVRHGIDIKTGFRPERSVTASTIICFNSRPQMKMIWVPSPSASAYISPTVIISFTSGRRSDFCRWNMSAASLQA